MNAVLAFIKLSLLEARRDRLYLGLVAFAFLFVALALLLGMSPWGHIEEVMLHLGFAGVSVFTLIYAVFMNVNNLHRDLQSRVLYTVFSRPVQRWHYLLGRFIGTALNVIILALVLSFIIILSTWYFGYSGNIRWEALALGYRAAIQALVSGAFALVFATFMSTGISIILAFMMHFICANVSIFNLLIKSSKYPGWTKVLFKIIYYVVPDFRYMNIIDPVIHQRVINWELLGTSSIVYICYIIVLLIMAFAVFQTREL